VVVYSVHYSYFPGSGTESWEVTDFIKEDDENDQFAVNLHTDTMFKMPVGFQKGTYAMLSVLLLP